MLEIESSAVDSADKYKADVSKILGYFDIFEDNYFLIVDYQRKHIKYRCCRPLESKKRK